MDEMNSKTTYLEYLKDNPQITYSEKKEVMQCITYDPRPGSYYQKVGETLSLDAPADQSRDERINARNDSLFLKKFAEIYSDLENGLLGSAERKLNEEIEKTERILEKVKNTTGSSILNVFNSNVEKELFLLFIGAANEADTCFLYGFPWLYYLQSILYEKTNLLPKAIEAINRALVFNPVSAEFTLRACKLSYMTGRLTSFSALEDCLNLVNSVETYYQYVDLVCYVYRIVMNDPYKADRIASYFTDRTLTPKENYRSLDREALFLLGKDKVKIRPKMMPFVPVSVCQRHYSSNKAISKYMELTLLDFFD